MTIQDDMIAGACAGAIGRIITAPFDVLKIRYQLQFTSGSETKYNSIFQAFRTIVKEEGIGALWKGNLSATYLWVSYSLVQFGLYGYLKNIINNNENESSSPSLNYNNINKSDKKRNQINRPNININVNSKKDSNKISSSTSTSTSTSNSFIRSCTLFLAGAAAGMIATAATYPFDIMRTQFAIQGKEKLHPNILSYVGTTMQTKGVKGFYAGLPAAVYGVAPYIGLNFAFYDTFKRLTSPISSSLNSETPLGFIMKRTVDGLAGGLAGGTSKLLIYPMDTIKKRMQLQVLQSTVDMRSIEALKVPHYTSINDCIRTTLRQEGVKGFFRGIVPTTLKSVVGTAVTFSAYEAAKDIQVLLRERLEYEKDSKSNKIK